MEAGLSRGWLGAVGGVLGTIPLLPIARTAALRLFSAPRLPGAASRAADVKGATYLEAAVLVVAIPGAALFFGHVLPRLFESRAAFNRACLEWPGAGFGLSLILWRSGLPAKFSLLGGILLAALATLAATRISGPAWDRARALLSQRNRAALFRIFLAGALWGLAWRSSLLEVRLPSAGLPAAPLLAGSLFVSVALLLSGAGQKDAG